MFAVGVVETFLMSAGTRRVDFHCNPPSKHARCLGCVGPNSLTTHGQPSVSGAKSAANSV